MHLISRFVDRNWYITSELERTHYMNLLRRALHQSDWRCLAYAVMSNHIHLAVVVGEEPLATWVRRVHSPFAEWLNRTHDRIGNVFVRGPKEIETPAERVGALIAYIHNNPVRAGVVTNPDASDWTSHRAYLGHVVTPSWLHAEDGLTRAGFATHDGFDSWVRTRPNEREVLRAIELVDVVEDRVVKPRLSAADIVRLTAHELGLPLAQLCSRRRTAAEIAGRRVAVHAAARLGIPGSQVAAELRMSQQAVSRIERHAVESALERLVVQVLAQAP